MQKASGAKRAGSPASLKERLALLQCGVLPVPPPRAGAQHRVGKRAKRVVRTSFVFGLACGCVLGGATLLLALVGHPGQSKRLQQALAPPDATSRLAVAKPDLRSAGGMQADALTQSAFEITLDAGSGGEARLPLRIVGVDRSENVWVLLRDVPATARLSRGERRDARTWTLPLSDLESLRLTLGEGTPEAFDMTVEVASAQGTQMAKAVAHVHVAERRDLAQARVPSQPVTATVVRSPTAAAPERRSAPGVDKPFRTEVESLARADAPTPPVVLRPLLPEGMSSLGGPAGGPAPVLAQPPESRTVWWKLPQPSWTPFGDTLGDH